MKNISPKTCKTVRLIYGWVFTAFTIVVGALFIWQVLDIYLGGKAAGLNSPFSYEIVNDRLKNVLAVPFWLWIATIVAGLILWEVFPVKEKLAPITDARYVMYRLSKRIPATVGEDLKSSAEYVKKQQKSIKIIHWCLLGVVAAYLIYIIVYVCIPSNLTDEAKATHEVMIMAAYILPVAAVVYAAGCAYVIALNKAAKNMLPHIKKLTAGVKAPQPVQPNKFTKIVTHKYFILGVRIAVACVGVAFIIAGCLNGSLLVVFTKAINICTECIGLG